MAKPIPPLPPLPPAATKAQTWAVNPKTGALSYEQLQRLWIAAGGRPQDAPLMAAIALAESGGVPGSLNDNPATGDYSSGLWQINYYGNLRADRTPKYGSPEDVKDPLKNAKAAVNLLGGNLTGLGNWQGDAAYKAYDAGGASGLNSWLAQYNASLTVKQQTTLNQAHANNPAYNQSAGAASTARSTATLQQQAHDGAYLSAVEAKAAALAQAKATAHQSDPWVTVLKDKKGNVTGFGEAIGQQAPNNTLLIGGVPATKSLYQIQWSNTYDTEFTAFTGRPATPAEQAKILESGTSIYALKEQWAKQPAFTSSPIYKATAAGIAGQAKQALGKNPPAAFVRDAIAQGWDANTTAEKIRELPGYSNGPDFQTNHAQALNTYQTIYGEPTAEANKWLKDAALKGWSSDEVGATLRADPAYKYSPEYQTKAVNFLDAMGLFTGTRAIAGVQPEQIVKQNTKGSKVGATSDLQVGVSGQ